MKLTALTVNYFRKTAPSLMFDRALNKLLLWSWKFYEINWIVIAEGLETRGCTLIY